MEKIDSFTGPYEFLSNFYPARVSLDGIVYPTVEHAYQASKTRSPEHRDLILAAKTPGQAKRLGRRVPMREDWIDVRYNLMREFVEIKFRDPVLRRRLLGTGHALLVEGNTWGDKIWGVCRGEGKNFLGIILMSVRFEIRQQILSARPKSMP